MYTSSDSFLFEYFQYSFLRDQGYGKYDTIQRADLRISDIGNLVGSDWVNLAHELDISDSATCTKVNDAKQKVWNKMPSLDYSNRKHL